MEITVSCSTSSLLMVNGNMMCTSLLCNIGTVNTILLNRESDFHSALLSPQMPHSGHIREYDFHSALLSPQMPHSGHVSSMDVDNEALQHMVLHCTSHLYLYHIHSSDGVSNGPLPTMSDADLAVSQHRIGVFLSTHMAYELLPESGKVIALDVDLPGKQAFHILHEQVPYYILRELSMSNLFTTLSTLSLPFHYSNIPIISGKCKSHIKLKFSLGSWYWENFLRMTRCKEDGRTVCCGLNGVVYVGNMKRIKIISCYIVHSQEIFGSMSYEKWDFNGLFQDKRRICCFHDRTARWGLNSTTSGS